MVKIFIAIIFYIDIFRLDDIFIWRFASVINVAFRKYNLKNKTETP